MKELLCLRTLLAPAALVLGAFLFAAPAAALGAKTSTEGATTGPDDDLGTLPSTQSGPPLMSDELQPLCSDQRRDPGGPVLVAVGPVASVETLLSGLSGPGTVTLGPARAEGTAVAVFEGELTWAIPSELLEGSPVRFFLRSDPLGGFGEVRTASGLHHALLLAPAQRLPLPLAPLYERTAGDPVTLAVRGWSRARYRLGIHVQGDHLLLRQRVR